MNLPGREEQGPTTSSPQLQDKNANHRTSSPNSPIPAMENGNQISNGNLQKLAVSEERCVLNFPVISGHVETYFKKAFRHPKTNNKGDTKTYYSYP